MAPSKAAVEERDELGESVRADAECALDQSDLSEHIAAKVIRLGLALPKRPHQLLQLAVVGLDDVVQVFGLTVLRVGR